MNFYDFGIKIKKTSGQVKTICPKCSHERRKKTEPCLSVNIDEGIWNCHNCGWTGSLKKQNEYMNKTYVKPIIKNKPKKYSENILKWFKERGISEKTLIQNKISEGEEWMPQISKKTNTIQFNYFREGKS